MKRAGGITAVAVIVLAGVYLLNWVGVLAFSNADGTVVAARLSADLGAKVAGQVHVTCPAKIPEKKGGIEDCQATAANGSTTIRIVQDDSRGHYHWTVNDLTVLVPTADPTPAAPPVQAQTSTSVTAACVGAGAAPDQCGCVEQQIRDRGGEADLTRAADAYNQRQPLPDDLARMVQSCRRGA